MPLDEMHVAENGFVEQCEDATTRMLARHRLQDFREILHQFKDHPTATAFVSRNRLSSSSAARGPRLLPRCPRTEAGRQLRAVPRRGIAPESLPGADRLGAFGESAV